MRLLSICVTAATLLGMPLAAQVVAKEPTPDVSGTLHLDSRAGTASAVLTHRFTMDSASSELRFVLNPGVRELRAECDLCATTTRDSVVGGLAIHTVRFRRALRPGERIALTTHHSAPLATFRDSVSGFTELALDDFWFPVRAPIGQHRFTSTIRVVTDTAGMRLAGSGTIRAMPDGWTLTSYGTAPDIALAVGSRLATWTGRARRTGMPLTVVARPEAEVVGRAVLGQVGAALGVLDSLLGPARAWDAAGVTVLLRPAGVARGRGGYSRTGYFVLPELADTNSYIAHVTHELAHGWWLGAERRHAWLDESLAEYTSVLAMRTLRSPAAADSMMAEKRRRVDGLPPLLGYDRDADRRIAPRMLYDKGPLLLAELHAIMGDEAFVRFLRAAARVRPRTTDALLAVLAETTYGDHATRFRAILAR